jgi:hypothetical protein
MALQAHTRIVDQQEPPRRRVQFGAVEGERGPATHHQVQLLVPAAVGRLDVILDHRLPRAFGHEPADPDDARLQSVSQREPAQLGVPPGQCLHVLDPEGTPAGSTLHRHASPSMPAEKDRAAERLRGMIGV